MWRYLWQDSWLWQPHLRRALPQRILSVMSTDEGEKVQVWGAPKRGPVCENIHLRGKVSQDEGLSAPSMQQEMLRRRLSALRANVWKDTQLQEPQVPVKVPPRGLLPLPVRGRSALCLWRNKGSGAMRARESNSTSPMSKTLHSATQLSP